MSTDLRHLPDAMLCSDILCREDLRPCVPGRVWNYILNAEGASNGLTLGELRSKSDAELLRGSKHLEGERRRFQGLLRVLQRTRS